MGCGPMTSERPLRVLFVASECGPWVKTGGLGDVIEALPPALRSAGLDVRVCLPGYRSLLRLVGAAACVARVLGVEVRGAKLPSGIEAYIIDAPWFFDRDGGPYQDQRGLDFVDNAARFGLFSRIAAILASRHSPLSWRPDVLHGHDWQAALAPVWLNVIDAQPIPSVMTVHNLAFQGLFSPQWIPALGLPAETYAIEGVEFYGQLSFLKGGLQYADALTTVSPTYAREIQDGAYGCGLEGLLARRSHVLTGIVNGIDDGVWNPETDDLITARYGARNLAGKCLNKEALQKRFGLPVEKDAPLFGVVSRLTQQKGIDLVLGIADRLVAAGAQLVVLGRGDGAFEAELEGLARKYPNAIAVHLGFDEKLAHEIEAGADCFLMPSRFEPCGLNQMYSQRYGTLPVVRATGGLADTVRDEGLAASANTTGFVFREATADALWEAVLRALSAYRLREVWIKIMGNAMSQDFGWTRSAQHYHALYKSLVAF